MSFSYRHLVISDKQTPKQPVHQFKTCARCEQSKAPEGGIDLGPGKWYCANCWAIRALRVKRKAA